MPSLALSFWSFAITIFGVAADHRELERDYGRHVGDSTAQWVVGCILLWIIVFPLYLLHRLDTSVYRRRGMWDEGDEVPQGTGAFCGACGTQQAAAARTASAESAERLSMCDEDTLRERVYGLIDVARFDLQKATRFKVDGEWKCRVDVCEYIPKDNPAVILWNPTLTDRELLLALVMN